ncbi:hypothetical protein PSA7680_02118 [Pseudoruegeria aquimaris]|uniref:Uncharacterized protein n=1 Tax=Pseudoruegeria aquimaris TaxID=393663 RepID=A0A1Y5SJN2_9RHOB|nr:hypothetical protein [Pseudoruegeria aquimaris]SLN42387.1 hypothetical protein PSA7680_02118 [Pseudoruegeria aquimaris]
MNNLYTLTSAILSAVLSVTPALSDTQDIRPVCKDGTLFLVPKSAHFGYRPRDAERGPVEPEYLDEARLPEDWPYDGPPQIVTNLHFAGFSWPKSLPGILEAFAGEKQEYSIYDLIIYESYLPKGDAPLMLSGWEDAKPSADYEGFDAMRGHEGKDGVRKSLLSTDITFFERPFSVVCLRGPSRSSKDPNAHWCQFQGALPDGSRVRALFYIANDLPGGWPPLDNAHETWRAPIQELEGAITNIIDQSGLGEQACASTQRR